MSWECHGTLFTGMIMTVGVQAIRGKTWQLQSGIFNTAQYEFQSQFDSQLIDISFPQSNQRRYYNETLRKKGIVEMIMLHCVSCCVKIMSYRHASGNI